VKSLGSQRNGDASPDGATLVNLLVGNAGLFLFSYSILKRSLEFWSENAEEILGVKDVAIARDANLFLRHVHPDDRFALLTELESAISGKGSYRATYRWIRPDTDENKWLHCRANLNETPNGKTLDGIIIDLSREFTGEISRITGPDSVQSVLAALPTLVCTVDRELRVVRINKSDGGQIFNFGDENFRFEDVRIGRPLFKSFSNEVLKKEYEDICKSIISNQIPHHTQRIALDEAVFTLEIAPLKEKDSVQGLLLTVSEITKMVQLEREMANLQRAEGLRLLAAGVAHNFNNTLQGILGHAAILANHSDNKVFVEKAGNAIIDLVNRASDLNKQLLSYQAQGSQESELLDLNTIIMSCINSVEDLFTSGLKVAVSFGNPERIRGRRSLIVEALTAIIKNSKEALAYKNSSVSSLAIKTNQVTLSQNELQELPAGDYAKVSISDSGSGMGGETLKRCFEPFFTTKERDEATGVGIKPSGLGLSRALHNIKDMGGALSIESAHGVGTTVAVYLPISSEHKNIENKITPLKRRTPEILVIDDDRLVLKTVATMISDLGYHCITADTPAAGLNLLKQNTRLLKLAIVDAMMPTMEGALVVKEIKKMHPSLPILGFSGATPQMTAPLLEAGAIKIISKPVSQSELKSAITEALAQRVPAVAAG